MNEEDAETSEGSWYLARDGEQLGPLTERELSLFADGGNFKPGDLLWTAGLESWKSAEDVFDLAPAGESETATDEPSAGEDLSAKTAADDSSARSSAEETGNELENDAGADESNSPDLLSPEAAREALSEALSASVGGGLAASPDKDAPFDDQSADALGEGSLGTGDLGDEDFQSYDPEAADPLHAPLEDVHFDGDHLDSDAIDGEHVGALAKALSGESEPQKLSFQQRMAAEFKSFAGLCGYLWAVFILLTLHAVVGGALVGLGVSFFLLTTLNAFLLTLAMPQLERRFLQAPNGNPLLYAILYKTALFVTALFVAYIAEMAVIGLLMGPDIGAGIDNLGGVLGTGMLWIVFFGALFPYFTFKEFEAAVGADMVRKLFLGKS